MATGNIRVYKRTSAKKFQCKDFPPCNRSFDRSEHLERHIRAHKNERPFECVDCNKKFTRFDNLRQHRENPNHIARYGNTDSQPIARNRMQGHVIQHSDNPLNVLAGAVEMISQQENAGSVEQSVQFQSVIPSSASRQYPEKSEDRFKRPLPKDATGKIKIAPAPDQSVSVRTITPITTLTTENRNVTGESSQAQETQARQAYIQPRILSNPSQKIPEQWSSTSESSFQQPHPTGQNPMIHGGNLANVQNVHHDLSEIPMREGGIKLPPLNL